MNLTRYHSPPPSSLEHGLWCRFKSKFVLRPQTQSQLHNAGQLINSWVSKFAVQRNRDTPAQKAAKARAAHDKKQDEKLADLQNKRDDLDKEIDRLVYQMRWERQFRPDLRPLTPPPSPREHSQSLSHVTPQDTDMTNAAPTLIENVKKVFGRTNREIVHKHAERRRRKRMEANIGSTSARRTLFREGVIVRDFQAEYDENIDRMTDTDAQI